MFFIYPENNAIVRVDVKAYKYKFSSKGIIAECENVFCYTMSKSIVDHKKLKKDEIVYFITKMCKKENSEVKLEDVMSFMRELVNVWNILDGESNEEPILKSGRTLLAAKRSTSSIIKNNKLTMDAISLALED